VRREDNAIRVERSPVAADTVDVSSKLGTNDALETDIVSHRVVY